MHPLPNPVQRWRHRLLSFMGWIPASSAYSPAAGGEITPPSPPPTASQSSTRTERLERVDAVMASGASNGVLYVSVHTASTLAA